MAPLDLPIRNGWGSQGISGPSIYHSSRIIYCTALHPFMGVGTAVNVLSSNSSRCRTVMSAPLTANWNAYLLTISPTEICILQGNDQAGMSRTRTGQEHKELGSHGNGLKEERACCSSARAWYNAPLTADTITSPINLSTNMLRRQSGLRASVADIILGCTGIYFRSIDKINTDTCYMFRHTV